MPGKVTLTVVEGATKGATFIFDKHDTFLCGRLKENHVCLSKDNLVSRYHCILEINPPDVCIRDLGSRNGTYINGKRYGGRATNETPEEGAQREYPLVDLQDGSKIGVGQTTLLVSIEVPESETRRLYCQRCKKDVSGEAGMEQQSTFICSACRQSAEAEPQVLSRTDPTHILEIIPGYQFVNELGKGGMGAVYLVRHIKDGHLEALKVMLPQVAVDEAAQILFFVKSKQLTHCSTSTLSSSSAAVFIKVLSISSWNIVKVAMCTIS